MRRGHSFVSFLFALLFVIMIYLSSDLDARDIIIDCKNSRAKLCNHWLNRRYVQDELYTQFMMYFSPEAVLQQSISVHSKVWSFGVLAWGMLPYLFMLSSFQLHHQKL